MGMVEDIIATLHKSAGSIRYQKQSGSNPENLPDLIQSYNEVSGLIRDVIGHYQTPNAARAYELCITASEDPYMWQEPAIANALEEITDEERLNIYDVILASRLPGKPKIPPRRRRHGYVDELDIYTDRDSSFPSSGQDRSEEAVDYADAGRADDEDDGKILA